MNNLTIILVFLLTTVMFISCEKQSFGDQYPNLNDQRIYLDQEAETRSSGVECLSCAAIDITLELISKQGQCGTSLLSIELVNDDCFPGTRHMVKLNEEVLTFFTTRQLDVEIDHCDAMEDVISVFGYDDVSDSWTANCLRKTLSAQKTTDVLSVSMDDLIAL